MFNVLCVGLLACAIASCLAEECVVMTELMAEMATVLPMANRLFVRTARGTGEEVYFHS